MISTIVQYYIITFSYFLIGCTTITTNQIKINMNDDILNLKDFGAKGDDKTDDTEAFVAALKSIKTGQKLYLPEGIYYLSAPLLLNKDSITIFGVKNKSIIKFSNKTDWYQKYFPVRVGMLNITASYINVLDLTFDQNFRASGKKDGDLGSIACIEIGGKYLGKPIETSNITIANCKFYDHYSDAINVFNARTSDFVVKNNRFISSYIVGNWNEAGVKGEQAIGVASGKNIIIENNIIEGALDDAIAIHVRSEDVKVLNNQITTTGGRILMNGTKNGEIRGNKIRYIQDGGTAICLSFENQAKNISTNEKIIVIENEIFIEQNVSVKSGILLDSPGIDIDIVNNKIHSLNGSGTGIFLRDRKHNETGIYHFGKNINIQDNELSGFAEDVKIEINDDKFVLEGEKTLKNLKNKKSSSALTKSQNASNEKLTLSTPKISRIKLGSTNRSSHQFIKTDNRYSFFFILEEPKRLDSIILSSIFLDKFNIIIVDTNKKERIFSERLSGDRIIPPPGIQLNKESEYRISIISDEIQSKSFSADLVFN